MTRDQMTADQGLFELIMSLFSSFLRLLFVFQGSGHSDHHAGNRNIAYPYGKMANEYD